jgi:uncharacterized protein (TIGR00251 family)
VDKQRNKAMAPPARGGHVPAGAGRETAGGPVTLRVRVHARASADGVQADAGSREVIVSVTAPAVEGKANRAMLAQLADYLSIARSSMQIISGEKSRRKVVRVHGLGEAEVWRRLAARSEVRGPKSE